MKQTVTVSCPVVKTARAMQLSGIFDLPERKESRKEWVVDLPIEQKPWNVGLIVGPSGSGKTRVARALFPDAMADGYLWGSGAVVDDFPSDLGIREIGAVLSSVGFSSPPSWLVPYSALSNGEKFRADLARTLVDSRDLVVVDEFTSVVDRTVAKIGSHAVQRAVRERGRKFVAVSCHSDIVEWLQPDWVYSPAGGTFEWRSLQRRPDVHLEIRRADLRAWDFFKDHHYLSRDIHRAAHAFVGYVEGRLAAFCATAPFPTTTGDCIRHVTRVVCLPDFQGIGIGNRMTDYVASLWKRAFWRTTIVTGHPAMMRHFAKSKAWSMTRKPGVAKAATSTSQIGRKGVQKGAAAIFSIDRVTATFEYVGPAASPVDSELFGMRSYERSWR